MPTIDHHDTLPASLPDDASTSEQEMTLDDDLTPNQFQSEVAKRIHLLGKLIIPPSAH